MKFKIALYPSEEGCADAIGEYLEAVEQPMDAGIEEVQVDL